MYQSPLLGFPLKPNSRYQLRTDSSNKQALPCWPEIERSCDEQSLHIMNQWSRRNVVQIPENDILSHGFDTNL